MTSISKIHHLPDVKGVENAIINIILLLYRTVVH